MPSKEAVVSQRCTYMDLDPQAYLSDAGNSIEDPLGTSERLCKGPKRLSSGYMVSSGSTWKPSLDTTPERDRV